MGVLNDNTRLGASAAGTYEIERSLRFNSADNAKLTRTPSSAGNNKKWTWSAWIKRGKITITGGCRIFGAGAGGGSNGSYMIFAADDRFLFIEDPNPQILRYTTRKFRDPSAWYHIVVVWDTANSTAADRLIYYVNGVRETNYTAGDPAQDRVSSITNAIEHQFGLRGGYNDEWFDGYLSEVHFCDGQAYSASEFGETDSTTGAWVPKKPAVTYGTTGFYLNFSDNSGTTATTLGKDSSGNGNNWTPNNISVSAGAGNDSVADTPTNNYATLNPLFPNGTEAPGTISDGNLKFVGSGYEYAMCPATMTIQNGKYYWEVTHGGGSYLNVGIIRGTNCGADCYISYDPNGNVFGIGYNQAGQISGAGPGGSTNGAASSTAPNSYSTDAVIGVAADIPNGTIKWYRDNNLEHTITGLNDELWFPAVSAYSNGGTGLVNFGQQGFTYTPPTGHVALCTANLPEPTIKDGSKHMNSAIYEGTGSKIDYISVGFQPDLTWIKNRDDSDDHVIQDSARGNKVFTSIDQTSEGDTGGGWVVEVADGFTADANGPINTSGESFVAWCWKESATAGFDIVLDTGTGADKTVAHNLGVKPDMMIRKARDRDDNWCVYHKDMDGADATEYLEFNTDSGQQNYHEIWNDTAPTSSVFSVGSDASVNDDTKLFVTYLFSGVEGYSKAGIYNANNNDNGTFVYTGFAPGWIMIKNRDSTGPWNIFDNKRETYNPREKNLRANTNGVDDSARYIDFLSNGFKLRSHGTEMNDPADAEYLYLAFAETPFKYATAR